MIHKRVTGHTHRWQGIYWMAPCLAEGAEYSYKLYIRGEENNVRRDGDGVRVTLDTYMEL